MRERRGATPPPPRNGGMRIGIVCYASVGGSGVVATELARALAGVRYAEGFVVREPVARPHLFKAGAADPADRAKPVEAPHA